MIINNKAILKANATIEEEETIMETSTMCNNGNNNNNNRSTTTMNDEGHFVDHLVFQPAGCPGGLELKKLVTNLMDRIVKESGKYTLAELGYLHMNLVSYCNGQVQLKVFFAPELATSTVGNAANGNGRIVPHPALNIFNGYMFVGELEKAVTYETMTLPEYYIERDNRDQLAVYIKDGKKKVMEDAEVVVLHCNLILTIAAGLDHNLWDENYKVDIETVGKTKKKDDDVSVMIQAGAYQEFPVRVLVNCTYGYDVGYNPDDAIPYLVNRIKKVSEANDTKKKLTKKVTDKAKEAAEDSNKKVKNNWKKFM